MAQGPFPAQATVEMRLDADPRYAGSAHDNATARLMGYKAALIPGAFVYGHATRLAVDAWGMNWITRGSIATRFRRPVYDGDRLTVRAAELVRTDDGVKADLRITNADDEEVVTGWIALPDVSPTAPDLADLPVLPQPDPPPAVGAGEMRAGARIGAQQAVLGEADVRASAAAFAETHPLYAREGVVHSGCLVRLTMRDALRSFAFPMPVVFAAVEAQHFAPARPGCRMGTSGTVTAAYSRRGRHYFDSEEYLIAEGRRVLARFRRVNLYAVDNVEQPGMEASNA